MHGTDFLTRTNTKMTGVYELFRAQMDAANAPEFATAHGLSYRTAALKIALENVSAFA